MGGWVGGFTFSESMLKEVTVVRAQAILLSSLILAAAWERWLGGWVGGLGGWVG